MAVFSSMFDKGALPVLGYAANFSYQRHQVIVNNLANVDTPHYKRLDLPVAEFRRTLRDAVARMENRPVRILDFRGGSRIGTGADFGVSADILAAKSGTGMLKHDDNNVSPDKEMVALSDNAMFHNALVQLMASDFNLMAGAIRERPGT